MGGDEDATIRQVKETGMNRGLACIALAAAGLALAGCAGSAAPAPAETRPIPQVGAAATAAPRVPVRLSYPTTGASASVIWVAAEAGFFARNGIDADVTYVESASTTLQALVSGSLDVAQSGGSAPVNGALAGTDTVIFAGLVNVLPYALMVDPDIREGADLRAKRIGISRYGSSSDFAARYLLKHYGLRPEEDAAILQVGSQNGRLAALKQGAIDGGMFELPFNVLIARAGYTELIKTADLLPYLHAAVYTTRGYAEQHEPALRQLTRALVETIAFMKADREATMQIMKKYTQEEDPAALEEAYQVYVTRYLPRAPYASLDGVRTILEEIGLTNPEALGQDAARFVDDRFVRELDASGFIGSLYP
jgi:NitT/TauT family transport system substrate-binding protein